MFVDLHTDTLHAMIRVSVPDSPEAPPGSGVFHAR